MQANSPYNPLEGDRPHLTLDLNDGTSERVSIIVVHNDRPEYLNLCLQSITVASNNNNYEIIVVDNGSKDIHAQSFLSDLEEDQVKVIRNEQNLYWAKAANQGVMAADRNSKYLIFMHHDIMVTNPSWIDLMVNVSESNKSGMVGVEMTSYAIPQTNQRVNFITESCVLVTRECWKDCGPFNEELPQMGAPFIFTLTSNAKGYNPQVIQNPCVHHWRVMALSVNEYERLAEDARARIPKLLMDLQKVQSN